MLIIVRWEKGVLKKALFFVKIKRYYQMVFRINQMWGFLDISDEKINNLTLKFDKL